MNIERSTPDVGYIDPEIFSAMGVSQMVSHAGLLHLSGVVATSRGETLSPDDIGGQVTAVIDTIERLLASKGLDLSHLIAMTCYTTDIEGLGEHMDRFAARFADHPPCSTWVEVRRLASPDYKLEIAAVAAL